MQTAELEHIISFVEITDQEQEKIFIQPTKKQADIRKIKLAVRKINWQSNIQKKLK